MPSFRYPSSLLAAILIAVPACREDPTAPTTTEATMLSTSATAALAFFQVSAGIAHTCGVTSDNKAYCWGANGGGRLGNGGTGGDERHTPAAVAGGLSFRQVSAGRDYTCGLTTDDRAYCWGTNFQGTLGDGTKTDRSTPVAVAGGRRFRQIRAGADHTCALNASNVAFCWGQNSGGQVGDGTTTERLTPVRVAGGRLFSQIAAGYYHSCGLGTNALIYCWGANFDGQLGDGTTTERSTPTVIRGGRSFRQVRAGPSNTCGVTTAGAAYCWGTNRYGQIGNGTSGYAAHRVTPTAVLGGLQFSAVSPGGGHTCGVTTGNKAYCWGNNFDGQVGDGTTTKRTTPVAVTGGLQFKPGVSTGYFHTCGVTTGDRAYCWGTNANGELGDGTETGRRTPVAVASP